MGLIWYRGPTPARTPAIRCYGLFRLYRPERRRFFLILATNWIDSVPLARMGPSRYRAAERKTRLFGSEETQLFGSEESLAGSAFSDRHFQRDAALRAATAIGGTVLLAIDPGVLPTAAETDTEEGGCRPAAVSGGGTGWGAPRVEVDSLAQEMARTVTGGRASGHDRAALLGQHRACGPVSSLLGNLSGQPYWATPSSRRGGLGSVNRVTIRVPRWPTATVSARGLTGCEPCRSTTSGFPRSLHRTTRSSPARPEWPGALR